MNKNELLAKLRDIRVETDNLAESGRHDRAILNVIDDLHSVLFALVHRLPADQVPDLGDPVPPPVEDDDDEAIGEITDFAAEPGHLIKPGWGLMLTGPYPFEADGTSSVGKVIRARGALYRIKALHYWGTEMLAKGSMVGFVVGRLP